MQPATKLVLVGVLVVLALGVARIISLREEGPKALIPNPRTGKESRNEMDTPGSSEASRVGIDEPEGDSKEVRPQEGIAELAEAKATAEAEEAVRGLRMDLHESLLGRLNPDALLAFAQGIADGECEPKILGDPGLGGGVRVALQGVHEGLAAFLEVNHSSDPEIAKVLTLEIQCDPEESAPFVEGSFRAAPLMSVKVWSDHDGNAKDIVIFTDIPPAYADCKQAGLDINQSTFDLGLVYRIPQSQSAPPTVRQNYFEYGLPKNREISALVQGPATPSRERMERFNRQLLKLHERVSQ